MQVVMARCPECGEENNTGLICEGCITRLPLDDLCEYATKYGHEEARKELSRRGLEDLV
jgi:hypothetical protein